MSSFLFSVRSDGLPSPNSTCDALFPGRTGHPKGTLRSPAANSDLFERVEGAFGCKKYLVPSDSQSLTLTVRRTPSLETVQDFLIKLDIKPLMHLLKISIFSLNNDILRLTKIMNNLVKDCKIGTFKVIFQCPKLVKSFQFFFL